MNEYFNFEVKLVNSPICLYFRTKLHTVQKQIADSHGSQCGFCTPGIVMSMYTLLRNDPCPKMEDVETYFQVQYHLYIQYPTTKIVILLFHLPIFNIHSLFAI